MSQKFAVMQSNYIPWKGYFDLINDVDTLIIYDDVQFTKNDWRNRNKIKTQQGPLWLTVPVGQDISRNVNEVMIAEKAWQKKHWKTLELNYKKQKGFSQYKDFFENFYLSKTWENLSEMNQYLIENICQFLKISTEIKRSEFFNKKGEGSIKLLSLLKDADAKEYFSGPAGLNYFSEQDFKKENIKLTIKKYGPYQQYDQPYGEFINEVSVLDLLFCCGDESAKYFKS